MKNKVNNLISLGTETFWGKVEAIGWLGERYYWLSKNGAVSMLPADVVEDQHEKQS